VYSTKYIFGFVFVMTSVVALLLSGLFMGWKEQSAINESIFNKRAILAAVDDYLKDENSKTMADEEVVTFFDTNVKQIALDMNGNELSKEEVIAAGYKGGMAEHIEMAKEKKKPEAERIIPFYIFDTGSEKVYIVSVIGNGLWDIIWGNIALKNDLSTIAGTSFDHKGETPGLGAEIKDNPTFPARFKNKEIYNDEGEFVSIDLKKTGAKESNPHAVDGISGATVTAIGVEEMLRRGIQYYEPYFNEIKSKKTTGMK